MSYSDMPESLKWLYSRATQMTPYFFVYRHLNLSTGTSVSECEVDAAIITELDHLLPQGGKKGRKAC